MSAFGATVRLPSSTEPTVQWTARRDGCDSHETVGRGCRRPLGTPPSIRPASAQSDTLVGT
jgi:hypothetical protein